MKIPFFKGPIPTGFPSPAADYQEKRIDLTEELIQHPDATFIVESDGYSMVNAFIPPKAKLLVDRSLVAKNGDIVVAAINGEFTVKYFIKNEYKCFLVPANPKYKDIEITPDMNVVIWGVVTYIITNPKDIKRI
jgi:DNA polymerase V